MPSYRHAIFDFDGVLCDSLAAAIDVFNELRRSDQEFAALPETRNQEDMVRVYGGSLRTCLSRWLDPPTHRRFFDLHSQAMAGRASELRMFDGIQDLIEDLPPASMSIVTSAYTDAVLRILGQARGRGAPRALHAIAGRELHLTKTAKIASLLQSLGLSNDAAVYIGDLESDVLYCRDVPIDVIAVSYGYHPAHHLESCAPDYLVDSVVELRALLGKVLSVRMPAGLPRTHRSAPSSDTRGSPTRAHPLAEPTR